MEWLYFSLIGAVAGVLAGLLGVGGGLVIVPMLALMLSHLGFPAEAIMSVAIATSLATIVITSLSSTYAHHRRGAVQWSIVRRLGLGLMLGALLASFIVDVLTQALLTAIFVVYALVVAFQLYHGRSPKAARQLPDAVALTGLGSVFGLVSGLVGIGGGTLVVPYLVWCNVAMRQAVATSSACGFFIAIASVVGFVFFVSPAIALPEGSYGYLYLPALLMISATSLLFAPLGAYWAHRLPVATLKKYFSLVLISMAMLLLLV